MSLTELAAEFRALSTADRRRFAELVWAEELASDPVFKQELAAANKEMDAGRKYSHAKVVELLDRGEGED